MTRNPFLEKKPERKVSDLTIESGKLISKKGQRSITYIQSPNYTKWAKMTPSLVLCHWTSGNSPKPAINWFKSKKSKVSAHLVIDRKGYITQMVNFERIAWHAGKSKYKKRKSVNKFSIGIELVNAGRVYLDKKGNITNRRGKIILKEKWLPETEKFTVEVDNKHYMCFTTAQLDSLKDVLITLRRTYNITNITDHAAVCIPKGRKIDCGPLLSESSAGILMRQAIREYESPNIVAKSNVSNKVKDAVSFIMSMCLTPWKVDHKPREESNNE